VVSRGIYFEGASDMEGTALVGKISVFFAQIRGCYRRFDEAMCGGSSVREKQSRRAEYDRPTASLG
jgi:hypothetical protein